MASLTDKLYDAISATISGGTAWRVFRAWQDLTGTSASEQMPAVVVSISGIIPVVTPEDNLYSATVSLEHVGIGRGNSFIEAIDEQAAAVIGMMQNLPEYSGGGIAVDGQHQTANGETMVLDDNTGDPRAGRTDTFSVCFHEVSNDPA